MVIRALSYDSPPILTNEIHCTSKTDALKWPAFKSKRYMLGTFMSLLCSAEFSFKKIVFFKCLSAIHVGCQTVWIKIMPAIFSLIWVYDVDKVYQRKSFRRQIFDVVGK